MLLPKCAINYNLAEPIFLEIIFVKTLDINILAYKPVSSLQRTERGKEDLVAISNTQCQLQF